MAQAALQRYELETELGQGGMSVVYRAKDRQLQRDVALKILHRYLAKQPDARRRLHREAMAVARLRHRAIVEIYDYSGPEAEDAFIVCELIDGPTLRELVELLGPPGPEIAMLMGLELCEALAHAHERGIIHRDLKPENVMITPAGQLKLMDFGIAQVLEGHTRLTATGTLVGSPAHMAPEVIDGKPADHRADIFSLGTLLYWLAVGALPFTAPHPSALFKRILDGDFEPADRVCPRVGRRISRLIDRCLATNADDRPASASELAGCIRKELAYVGLDASGERLRTYLSDPETVGPEIEQSVVDGLIERAREAVDARQWGRASDDVNRILARQPDHEEAQAILDRLLRGERRLVWMRRGGAALLPAGALALFFAFGVDPFDANPTVERGAGPRETRDDPPSSASGAVEPAPPTGAATKGEPAPFEDRPAGDRAPTADAELIAARRPASAGSAPDPERRSTPGSARATPPPAPAPSPVGSPTGSASASAAQTASDPDPAPFSARLSIQIGRGYADVWVDDALVLDLTFQGEVDLTPGRHAIEVVRDRTKILARLGIDEVPTDRPFPQFGRFEPRLVDVDEEGRIFELGPDGPRELKDGVLRFSIPTTPREANRIDSWISS